jgi:hypothetical protein
VSVFERFVISARTARSTFSRGVSRARIAVFNSSRSRGSNEGGGESVDVEYSALEDANRRCGLMNERVDAR